MAQQDAMDDSETDDDDDESGYDTDVTVDAENPGEDGERRLREYYAREERKAAKRLIAAQQQQTPSTPPHTDMIIVDTPSTEVVPDPRSRIFPGIQPLNLFGADDDDAKNGKYKGKGGASKSRRRSKRRRAKKTLRKRRTSRKRRTARRRKTRSKK